MLVSISLLLMISSTHLVMAIFDSQASAFNNCGLNSTANWEPWNEQFETDLPIVYPTSTAEVQTIVSVARDHGCRIRPTGTTHSVDGIIARKTETDVIVMSLADYVAPLEWDKVLDEDLKRVRMSAGATQLDFIRFIRPKGYTCRTCTGSPLFSLGGVYMNPSVHGSIFGEGRYAGLLTAALVVDGLGNVREIGEDRIMEWRGSMGLLGVVLAVEIRIKEDEGREKINNVYTFKGDNWNKEAITTTIRNELAGKEGLNLEWDYHSGKMLFTTTRVSGSIDLQLDEARYDDFDSTTPDLAKNGGPKNPLYNFLSNLLITFVGGGFQAGWLLNSRADSDEGPYDGFNRVSVDGGVTSTLLDNIASFIPCPDDCVDDGQLFALLNTTRAYFDANRTRMFPSYFIQIRLIDVFPEPTMVLEQLLPGRYIAVDYLEFRFLDKGVNQPYSTFLQGLQQKWDEVGNFKGSYHLGKEYAYGSLGDLPGVYPFQDESIINRIFNATTRAAFANLMAEYDPDGIFAAGSGLRLLGIDDVKYDIRRSSIENSIAATTSCKKEGNAECLSNCCLDDGLFASNQCTAVTDSPQGSSCKIDCNCASGKCNFFLFWKSCG